MDEHGNTFSYSGIQRDITNRKKAIEALSRSNERLLTVLNSLEAIVYVVDMDTYEVLFINKYVSDLFGDIVGEICWQSIQKDQTGPCEFCTNKYLLDERGDPKSIYHWEFQNTQNGHWYDIRDRAIEWVDGRIVRLEIATDSTKHKLAEEELEKHAAKLERLIKSFVGRELRMVELKKEIEELKKRD